MPFTTSGQQTEWALFYFSYESDSLPSDHCTTCTLAVTSRLRMGQHYVLHPVRPWVCLAVTWTTRSRAESWRNSNLVQSFTRTRVSTYAISDDWWYQVWVRDLSPLPPMKHTGQESAGELCEIFKFWSFLQSKSVNNVYKIHKQYLQTASDSGGLPK